MNTQPLFVMTSRGLLNLARVQYAEMDGGEMCFVFAKSKAGHDALELPEDEGQKIIQALLADRTCSYSWLHKKEPRRLSVQSHPAI